MTHIAFIATLGDQPQVVTTALDLLLDLLRARGIRAIDEVFVVHTQPPPGDANNAVQQAIETLKIELRAYTRSGHLKKSSWDALADGENNPISDVTTPSEADAVYRTLRDRVGALKRAGWQVHLCAAGGRKGMTAFAMSVAHMYLRPERGDGL
jgi:CRISPR-associated protein (TIGR02584 family)